MNDDSHQGLESVGNEALEARLVAWVLGEASAFEAAELEGLYEKDKEIALFVDRLRLLDGLVREEPAERWQLGEAKRAAVLDLLGEDKKPVARRSHRHWWSVAAAAVVMIVAIGGAFSTMGKRAMKSVMSEDSIMASYSAASAEQEATILGGADFRYPTEYEAPELPNSVGGGLAGAVDGELGFPVTPATPTQMESRATESRSKREEVDHGVFSIGGAGNRSGDGAVNRDSIDALLRDANQATPADPFAAPDRSIIANGVEGEQAPEDDWKFNDAVSPVEEPPSELAEKAPDASMNNVDAIIRREIPAAPSSSMAKSIAANTTAPSAVPVPELSSIDPSLRFGSGDDFGDGWGGGSGSGGGGGNSLSISDGEADLSANGVGDTGSANHLYFFNHGAAVDEPAANGVPTLGDIPRVGALFQQAGDVFEVEGVGGVDLDPFMASERYDTRENEGRDRYRGEKDSGSQAAEPGNGPAATPLAGYGGIQNGKAKVGKPIDLGRSDLLGSQGEIRGVHQLPEMEKRVGDDYDDTKAEMLKQVDKAWELAVPSEQGVELDALSDERDEAKKGRRLAGQGQEGQRETMQGQAEVQVSDRLLNESIADASVIDERLQKLDDPIRTNPALTDEHSANVDKVRQELYKGQGYYDLGQFEEAKEEYESVLRTDPYNSAARRGMEQVAAAKSQYYRAAYDQTRAELLQEVDNAWEMDGRSEDKDLDGFINYGSPIENGEIEERQSETKSVGSALQAESSRGEAKESNGREAQRKNGEVERKFDFENGRRSGGDPLASMRNALDDIVIPNLDFEDVTLQEAVDFLRAKSIEEDRSELDPEKKGVGLRVELPKQSRGDDGLGLGGIQRGPVISELKLKNVPLGEALDYMAESTRMRWSVEDDGIVFKPATEVGEDLVTRTFNVPDDFFTRLTADADREDESEVDPFAAPDQTQPLGARSNMVELLKARGIHFPEDASAQFFAGNSTVLLRNTPTNLDLFESLTNELLAEKQSEAPLDRMGELSAADEPYSTFSLHVSDSSFKLASAAMERGEAPDVESIRPEEFYNAFDYGDPAPAAGEPVACAIEQSAHPAFPQRNLMRVGVRTGSAGRAKATPLNLTLLLDNSGSMEREDRAEGVAKAVEQLASLLQPGDKVTVAGFSRQPRLLVDRLDGAQAAQLNDLVAQIPSEGGTNLEQALELGDQLARRQYVEGAQNRVVLFTDGAANLGDADPESLNQRVDVLRQNGIAFDAAGFGADGLNDRLLERLTRNGNGRYYVVDDPDEAGDGFADKLAGAFRPEAENVKVQVVFNPSRVGNYKLIGFEKHRLKKEDFRNDSVDAAEMASEEAGVALYQFEVLPEGEGEIGEVSVRFRDVASGQMVERTWTIPYDSSAPAFDQAAESLQLAGLAAFAAEKLRGAPMAEVVDLAELAPVIGRVSARYADDPRIVKLRRMLEQLR